MQDGNQNGQAASASNATHVLSATPGRAFLQDGNAAISFLNTSNQICSGGSMTNGAESWSHSSIRLSSGFIQSGSCGASPSGENPQFQEIKRNSSDVSSCVRTVGGDPTHNHSSSTLKEHDYIGLSSDLSSSSVHGGIFGASFVDEKCVGRVPDLDSEETELRLGLGPHESAKQESDRGGEVDFPNEGSASSAIASACNSRKDVFLSSVDGDESSFTEKSSPGSCDGLSRPYIDQEMVQSWNGEKRVDTGNSSTLGLRLFSSRGLIQELKVADRRNQAGQGRPVNETQGQEMNYHLTGQTRSSQGINFQPSEIPRQETAKQETCSSHAVTYGQGVQAQGCLDYTSLSKSQSASSLSKPYAAALDFRFAHQNPPSVLERSSFDSALTAQKHLTRQVHISRSLERHRSSSNQDASQPSVLELENRASVQGNAGVFSGQRYLVPVPKCTVPAKRGFQEAIGPAVESRAGFPMVNRTGSMDLRSNVTGTSSGSTLSQGGITVGNALVTSMEGEMNISPPQTAKHPSLSLSYLWNNPVGSWQMGPDHQSKAQVGSIPQKPPRGPMPSPQLKVAAEDIHGSEAKASSESGSSKQAMKDGQHNTNLVNDGGAPARAPVVGWPPVRSFRKNTLSVASHTKPSSDEEQVTAAGSSDEPPAVSTTFYVKANMDGVPIGRKVDLKAYDSYEGLKLALQDMFQRFINGNNGTKEIKQLNLLQDTEYVLTHKDKDGDWMLVGDVPWKMFVSSVKRLKIMKSCESIGLGQTPKCVGNKC